MSQVIVIPTLCDADSDHKDRESIHSVEKLSSDPIPCCTKTHCSSSQEVVSTPVTSESFKLCARGCPLVDGVCPIDQSEYLKAVEMEAKSDTSASKTALAETKKWQQRAVILSVFTILYGIVEGTIGLALGAETVSISLLAFGADSWVEVISGSLVCWRFYEELTTKEGATGKRTATQKERIITLILGLLLTLLSLAVIGGSIGALVTHDQPESSVANIAIGCVSIVYMGTLYILKTRVAISLKSATVETDAQCSLFCVQLSLVLVIGAVIFREVNSVWWFDSATAIVIALMIGKEGIETIRASQQKDFTGAGCGCEGEDDGLLMKWMRKKLKQPAQQNLDEACNTNNGCEIKKSCGSTSRCKDNKECVAVESRGSNDLCKIEGHCGSQVFSETRSNCISEGVCGTKRSCASQNSCEKRKCCDEKDN